MLEFGSASGCFASFVDSERFVDAFASVEVAVGSSCSGHCSSLAAGFEA